MNFSELGVAKRIVSDVEALGFVEPTEIQVKTIPSILAGRDIMASAETGSGKTAAYGLPIVQALRGGSERLPRALVLVPTRELALQVDAEIKRFSNNCGIRTVTVYGGVGYEKQVRLLRRGVDVVVATPGRLFDLISQGDANLSAVTVLVLDEADRMLDMGFTPQVRKIVSGISKNRQTIMFSATINKAVEQSAEEFLKDPVNVFVNTQQVEPSSIEQRIYQVEEDGKTDLLIKLIKEESSMKTVLVFTKTRWRAAKLCKKLNGVQISSDEIHSDISQNKRERTLARYRAGEFSVLVATDIAARGLDIPAISHVINFDLPTSPADYVHRIGRTGRAGRVGTALSFVSAEQRKLVREIEKVTGHALDPNGTLLPEETHRRSSSPRGSQRRRPASGGGYQRAQHQSGEGFFSKKREANSGFSGEHRKRFDDQHKAGEGVFGNKRDSSAHDSEDRGQRHEGQSKFGGGNFARKRDSSSHASEEHGQRHEGQNKFGGGNFARKRDSSSHASEEHGQRHEGQNKFGGSNFARKRDSNSHASEEHGQRPEGQHKVGGSNFAKKRDSSPYASDWRTRESSGKVAGSVFGKKRDSNSNSSQGGNRSFGNANRGGNESSR